MYISLPDRIVLGRSRARIVLGRSRARGRSRIRTRGRSLYDLHTDLHAQSTGTYAGDLRRPARVIYTRTTDPVFQKSTKTDRSFGAWGLRLLV